MKTIILTAAAARDLDALPATDRRRVSDALIEYAMSGRGDVQQLRGRDGYRLRVGRFRVILDEERTAILAVYVGRRQTTAWR